MAVNIIDNCCSTTYLDCLKDIASDAEHWNLKFPAGKPAEDKFPKLNIINENGINNPSLAGLALGLLIQIYEAGGRDFFLLEPIHFCGISIKDKYRPDNIHTDYEKEDNFIKILGIINSDWKEEWGGRFFHNGTSNYIKPTSFCIFDPSKEHSAEEILSDKKRFAIDFTVFRDQQSLEKTMKIGNK